MKPNILDITLRIVLLSTAYNKMRSLHEEGFGGGEDRGEELISLRVGSNAGAGLQSRGTLHSVQLNQIQTSNGDCWN